ncbi:MAG: Transcriptional repressor NrdR [Chlamydiae bacterium]|nr:Transcriptional repressor NrdR [Chlamydiota bacterium]
MDSRDSVESNAIRRRRECQDCQRRFTTFETIELSIQVLKRDGRYEDFQQQKLVSGLQAACHHTKISREQVHDLAAKITAEIAQMQERVISTHELGEVVMGHLRALDPVAYIRFACVYRRFKDIDEVMREIKINVTGL